MDGTFDTADGTAAASTSVATADLKMTPVTPTGTEYVSSVILSPQTVQGNSISLSVVLDGITYNAALVLPAATGNRLTAGYNIAYTVTINKSKLEVNSGEIADWTDVPSGSGTANIVPMGNVTEKTEVRVGDYAMADGTFVSKGTTLTERQKRNCVDIVFFTTAEARTIGTTPAKLTDDKIMNTDFPDCKNGLIEVLTEVSTGCLWQGSSKNNYESVYNQFQATDLFNPTKHNKADYTAIESDKGANDNINKILGYNNTQVLIAYNEYCSKNNKGNYIVKAVEELVNWAKTHSAPKGTTGWFLPSVKELVLLRHGDVDDVYKQEDKSHSIQKMFNNLLSSVNGNQFPTANIAYGVWSSSERKGGNNLAWIMDFPHSDYVDTAKKAEYNKGIVRAVCAF